VELDFADHRMARVLESAALMKRELGPDRARKLAVRLATLRAVDYAIDLLPLPGRWHILSGDWSGHMSADLDHPNRLLVRPQDPVPRAGDGGVDWSTTTAVTIVGIFDTH
jgi:proteic killer suppression protein